MKGVIEGVAYLHSQSVIHGDIKGVRTAFASVQRLHSQKTPPVFLSIHQTNVLIGDDGTPLLCDFGLAKICEPPDENERIVSTTVRRAGTVRYMSVELHMSEAPGSEVTMASDMWAFGMFCVEVCSSSFHITLWLIPSPHHNRHSAGMSHTVISKATDRLS